MAQTYKFGNGTWATKKGSTLAYSDTNNAFKPLPFSFERNSIATRVNKEGLIEVVGNDIPRIDYTDSTEGALLLENSAENLVTYSEAFDNAYWTKDGASVIDGQSSPDGKTNAYKLTEGSNNGIHRVGRAVFSANVERTLSVFAKKGERNFISLFENNTASPAIKGVIFNLDNGTYYNNNSSFYSNVKIELISNGWYRCSATSNNTSLQVPSIGVSADGLTNSYQGDGTSGIYIFGAMLEANSVASSYIPTNGSTVQRAAETCNESGNSEVFNDSQGVLFANISALIGAGGGTRRIEVSNSVSASQYVRLQIANGDGSLYANITNNSGQQVLFNVTSFDATLSNKISLKYKQNDFSLFLNGFEVGSSNVGNTFANGILTQANFSSTASEFYGKTKEIGYYDEILTDEELEYMTSYRSLNEMVTELNLNAL